MGNIPSVILLQKILLMEGDCGRLYMELNEQSRLKSQHYSAALTRESSLSDRRPRLFYLTTAIVFIMAMAIRIYFIQGSNLIAESQFRSALIARAFYFNMTDSVPEWRRQANLNSLQRLPVKEPPVTEFLVSAIYWSAGGEHLWFSRVLTSLFWIVGGVFMFEVAKRIVSLDAAVFAVAYYLFVPIGVHVSLSFLPDSLMIMTFLAGILTILRYYDHPSTTSLFIAAVISGLAILVKPLCLFTLLGAFFSLAIYRKGGWRYLVGIDTLVFIGICILPIAFYYLYGIFITQNLATQAQVSFLPQLVLQRDYWKDWLLNAAEVVGVAFLIAALLGVPMIRPGISRALLLGLWIGYIVFGLVFTYHIRFASHYHLQLVIIVALSSGPIIVLVKNRLLQLSLAWYWWLPVVGALLLGTLITLRELRQTFGALARIEDQRVAQEIGEIVGHSNQTIYIASYYGRPLEYFGELSGTYWPRKISDSNLALGLRQEMSVEERLKALEFIPEYFIITDFNEFNRHHPDLKKYLAGKCSLLAESEKYLIYDACTS
jgi:4-amino-4-deoxy-L-arabinose transferase-like glycosyltransferase